MSEVIRFLDAAGSNPHLSAADFAAAVAMLQIDAGQKQALLDGDHLALSALLDGRAKMYCYINAPDDDDRDPMQPPLLGSKSSAKRQVPVSASA